MAKNYYIVLGVSPTESPRGIHEAFRQLAKQHHPDRTGPHGTRAFQEILEAYEVLSDPDKRRLHNRDLYETKPVDLPRPEPINRYPSRVEPLIPEPRSIRGDFQTVRPGYEPLFDRLFRNFSGLGIPKGEHIEGLYVEIALSSAEAMAGAVIPVGVPVFYTCPVCEGSGRNWLFPCIQCGEQGMIEEEETVNVRIPPMVRDGTVLELPIHGLGIHNFYLCLHIRIDH
jgi:DnaJ-class molecular chaperone